MLLFFPCGPNEITITEIFFETLLPPVPLFENTLDDSWIITRTNVEFPWSDNLVFGCWSLLRILLTDLGIQVVRAQNRRMKLIIHPYFQIQYKVALIKKLSQRQPTIELLRYRYPKLLHKFGKFLKTFILTCISLFRHVYFTSRAKSDSCSLLGVLED